LIRRVLFRRFCKNEDEDDVEVEIGVAVRVDVGGFMVGVSGRLGSLLSWMTDYCTTEGLTS
jgi:hypothetical protein